MPRKRERSSLQLVAEALEVADLRLKLADSLPNPRVQRTQALSELIEARKTLDFLIGVLSTELTLAKAKRKGPKRANHKNQPA